MAGGDKDAYSKFWKHFGRVLKEGVSFDFENKDKLTPLLWFDSSNDDEKQTTLKEYVARMKSDQEEIFYLTGDSRSAIASSPHLEAFKARDLEVLFLSDPIDELMVQSLTEFEDKKLKSIAKGTVDLGTDEEQKKARKDLNARQTQFTDIMALLKTKLDKHVKEVRLTNRLTDSPACLVVAEEDFSPHMERILQAQQGRGPETAADHGAESGSRDRSETPGEGRGTTRTIPLYRRLRGAASGLCTHRRRVGAGEPGEVQPGRRETDGREHVATGDRCWT